MHCTHCIHCRCFPPPPALAPYRSVAEAVHLGTSDAPGCTAEEGVSGAFAFGLAVGAAPVTATDATATDVTVGASSEVLSPHPHQALAVPLPSAQQQQQQQLLRLQQQQQRERDQDQQSSVYRHDSSDEADVRAAVAQQQQQQQQQDDDSSQQQQQQRQQQQQQQRSFARGAQGSRQELMEQLARAASEQGVSESDAIAWIIERMEAENQVTLHYIIYI
jgi:hypothetical protein